MSLRSAAAHRNLLYLLSLKELRTRYKKSVLGWAWSLLNPVMQTIIFSIIFLKVFVATPPTGDPSGIRNFPAYFLCGLLPFNFFSISVSVAIGSLQGGSGLIKKVQFPHEHLVFSVVVAQFFTLMIELCVLVAVLLMLGSFVLPWLPVLLLVLVLWSMFTTGVALLLAAANVFYHDVNYLWTILQQVLFYMTPVIYSPSAIPSSAVRFVANYGPTGAFIVSMHNILYDLRFPGLGRVAYMAVLAVGVFVIGSWSFNRLSPKFAEEM